MQWRFKGYMIKNSKSDKKEWILEYMSNPVRRHHSVDITEEEFVNAYIDKFNPDIIEWYPYCAPKVPEIVKLLAELYKENKVFRYRHYCDIWQDGYPRWFYIYFLKDEYK